MAKLHKPVLFSEAFGIPAADLDTLDLLDPILNADTKLFIDPLLLRSSKNGHVQQDALQLLKQRFGNIIRLGLASKEPTDAAWKAAHRLLDLEERKETCLGFGGSSVSGSSRPERVKSAILRTTLQVISLGIDDPEIISLMGFLENDVGPDTISDLTTNAIFPALEKITADVCQRYGILRQQFFIEGQPVNLPTNPFSNGRYGIALVPRDILRELPIASDWSDVSRVAFENKLIRDRVNLLIADFAKATISEKKRVLKTAALQSAEAFLDMFDGLLSVPDKAYSSEQDQAGIYAFRQALREVASQYPHKIDRPKGYSKQELKRVVDDIVDQFKKLIERNDISDLLWHGGQPRNEKAAQLVFFAVADAYCKANNIDISPETDSGGGPVDFKFSTGYDGRYLVELKLSTGRVVHGYKTQIAVYREASEKCDATFLVVSVGKIGKKLTTIRAHQRRTREDGAQAPEIVVVDATKKASASKR